MVGVPRVKKVTLGFGGVEGTFFFLFFFSFFLCALLGEGRGRVGWGLFHGAG